MSILRLTVASDKECLSILIGWWVSGPSVDDISLDSGPVQSRVALLSRSFEGLPRDRKSVV